MQEWGWNSAAMNSSNSNYWALVPIIKQYINQYKPMFMKYSFSAAVNTY